MKVTRALDRETTPQYTLTVVASDQSYSSSAELIITLTDVNDESPTFSRVQYSFSVSERASINEVRDAPSTCQFIAKASNTVEQCDPLTILCNG